MFLLLILKCFGLCRKYYEHFFTIKQYLANCKSIYTENAKNSYLCKSILELTQHYHVMMYAKLTTLSVFCCSCKVYFPGLTSWLLR